MSPARRRFNIELTIVLVGLLLFTFEVIWGGGRPSVLPFIVGLIVSPAAKRIDDNVRKDKEKGGLDESPRTVD